MASIMKVSSPSFCLLASRHSFKNWNTWHSILQPRGWQTLAHGPNLAHCVSLLIKFYWNAAKPMFMVTSALQRQRQVAMTAHIVHKAKIFMI